MAIITVVGSSGTSVQVTVDGGQTQTLAQQYADNILSAANGGTLTAFGLVAGSNAVPSAASGVVQGDITAGGVYTLTGSDLTNLVIGSNASKTPNEPLSSPVTVNAAGVTGSSLSVLAGGVAGTTFNAGNTGGSFVATAGDNTFNAASATGNWAVTTGAGNDTIHGSTGTNTISGGAGDNLITLGLGNNFVLSEGHDTIDGTEGSTDTVTLMGGSSQVALGSNSVVVDVAGMGGSGANTITVGDGSTVFGGTSSHVAFASSTGTIVGAMGDTVSATGDLQVVHGCDQDISVSGALQFISGTGNTSISAGTATIWGSSGLHLNVDSSGQALWTANQPHTTGDQYVDASSNHGTLDAWTGAGNATVIGGTGADRFVFGTKFDGTMGDSFATVTGGTGAANMFGVLAGHTGGDVTITDFGSAAGNMFFMYNYKPADEAKAIQDLLSTATVSGGNTTLQLDNNMKVTFLGVSDLKASQINIS